jgi:hypothetical protein
MVGEAALKQHTDAMVTGRSAADQRDVFSSAHVASRPIRKFIAFSSPLLLGIPPVDHKSFSRKITKQSAMPLRDRHNHEISNVEVSGTQKSADLRWDNSKITCWALPTCSTAKAWSTLIRGET